VVHHFGADHGHSREQRQAVWPASTVWHGRGQGIRERLGLLGLATQPEKEIILIALAERVLEPVMAP